MKRFLLAALFFACLLIKLDAFDGNPCCIPQRRDPIICFYDCIKYTSQSFMFTRPANMNLPMYQSMWHSLIYSEDPCSTSFQLIGFYQESQTNKHMEQYFLINRKVSLEIRGDDAPDAHLRDVRSSWLGINNDQFRGTLAIHPEQKQFGFTAEFYQVLGGIVNIDILQDWWISVKVPVVLVENNIGLQQTGILNKGTNGPADIVQAFNQREWKFAKMKCNGQTKAGVAEINAKVGATYLGKEGFELAYYTGFSGPLSNTQDGEFLFSPFVGNNGHASVEGGINMQFTLNCDTTCQEFCWFIDLESHWLLPNRQCRTFDLRNKQWGRYLQLNVQNGPPDQNIPGVNILTRETKVHPYILAEFSTGCRYLTDSVEAEIGYTLWGHGNEKLRLICPFPEIYGIAGTGFMVDPQTGMHIATSASQSTIANKAPNDVDANGDPIFVTIKAADIDLLSAESRTAINHRLHASLGYRRLGGRIDAFLSFGAYYEWPQRNSALEVGGAWAKFGASF